MREGLALLSLILVIKSRKSAFRGFYFLLETGYFLLLGIFITAHFVIEERGLEGFRESCYMETEVGNKDSGFDLMMCTNHVGISRNPKCEFESSCSIIPDASMSSHTSNPLLYLPVCSVV